MLLRQDCPPPLINSTTGYCYSIGMHSTSLWLAFLTNLQQGRALEHAFVVLNPTSTHCHAYWKYTRSLLNTDTSIFRTYAVVVPMVSALEGFPTVVMSIEEQGMVMFILLTYFSHQDMISTTIHRPPRDPPKMSKKGMVFQATYLATLGGTCCIKNGIAHLRLET